MGEEKEPTYFETAYRSWNIGFNKKGEPRLLPLNRGEPWEPGEEGEVVSDWAEGHEGEEARKKFEKSSQGFYSLKSLKAAREYHQEGVHGAIIPHGIVHPWTEGFRSTKATVRNLYKRSQACWICGKPAKWVLRVKGEAHFLCEPHLGRLKKLIEKEHADVLSMDDLLQRLAQAYDAELVDYPEGEV